MSYEELDRIIQKRSTVCSNTDASIFVCKTCVHIYVTDARYNNKNSPHDCMVCGFTYCKRHMRALSRKEYGYICEQCNMVHNCAGCDKYVVSETYRCKLHNSDTPCCKDCHTLYSGCVTCITKKMYTCRCGTSICAKCIIKCVECLKIAGCIWSLCSESICCDDCPKVVCEECSVKCLTCELGRCKSCATTHACE